MDGWLGLENVVFWDGIWEGEWEIIVQANKVIGVEMGKWEGSIHSLGKCVLSAYVLDPRLFDTGLVKRVNNLD